MQQGKMADRAEVLKKLNPWKPVIALSFYLITIVFYFLRSEASSVPGVVTHKEVQVGEVPVSSNLAASVQRYAV